VVADGGHHLVAPLGDRQVGVGDRGECGHGRSVILRTPARARPAIRTSALRRPTRDRGHG
jgi:hypothetical protein